MIQIGLMPNMAQVPVDAAMLQIIRAGVLIMGHTPSLRRLRVQLRVELVIAQVSRTKLGFLSAQKTMFKVTSAEKPFSK